MACDWEKKPACRMQAGAQTGAFWYTWGDTFPQPVPLVYRIDPMTLPPAPAPSDLRSLFSLDFSIHFLNHGSFGACPRSVLAEYQEWQRRLESQPVLFLGRQLNELEGHARQVLAEYLHIPARCLVFIPNATYGVNILSRSLTLQPGDEILTSSHEYGACEYAWEFACQKSGAKLVRQPVDLPVESQHAILESFWEGVNSRTKVIYLSHITSPTALEMPVQAICGRARAAGILTIIDGAHAPGQIPLDLEQIEADFYFGNCHKWMLSPKGAGFLYARPEVQELVQPLIVSWGYHATPVTTRGSRFLDHLGWTGTHDPAAYLSVPAAIQFARRHGWAAVGQECRARLQETLEKICSLTGLEPPYPLDSDLYHQMAIAPLPDGVDAERLKAGLYDEHRVEVPITIWNGRSFLRISVQGYNTPEDLDALVHGLQKLLSTGV
jgi:isopenicillin-N epimerase